MQYFDVIFTLHSQRKLAERGITLEQAWEAFKHPSIQTKQEDGSFKISKEFDNFKITVIAFQNKKSEWAIKSAWRNPPLPGTTDAKQKETWKKYNKAGFWGKIFLQLKQQLGL